jgi:uncharacterized membrane protein
MTATRPSRQLTSRNRLEAFSDGVIAISITLTVLSITFPRGLPKSQVAGAIIDLIPDVLVYLLSFAVIGMFWMSHHFALDRIERIDRRIILLNLAFLAAISLMPLVTGLLNEYANGPAVMTYATVMTLASLSLLALWLHAERRGLVSDRADKEERSERTSRLSTTALVFAASIPVALASPAVAQYLWLLILLRPRMIPLLRRARGLVRR